MSNRHKNKDVGFSEQQFEAFMQESISSSESSMVATRHRGRSNPWPGTDRQFDFEDDYDTVGTKRSFMKSRNEPASKPLPSFLQSDSWNNEALARVSKDSLEDSYGNLPQSKNYGVPDLALDHLNNSQSFDDTTNGPDCVSKSSVHPGKDTLDEMAEKDNFFRELKGTSGATLDYGRLIRDMDNSETGTFNPTDYRANGGVKVRQPTEQDHLPVRAKPVDMLSQVNLTDSLDSTLDKDNRPSRVRLNEDMRPIAESTGEQATARHNPEDNDARHDNDDDDVDVDEEEEDEGESNEEENSGLDFVDGKTPQNVSDLTYITQHEDGSSDNKVTDTTTKGGMLGGKTASGFDTSHDMEAIRQELRKLGTFSSTNDFTFRDSTGGGGALPVGTSSQPGSMAIDNGSQAKFSSTGADTAPSLNRVIVPVTEPTAKYQVSRDDAGQQKRRPGSGPAASDQQQTPSVRFNDQTQAYSPEDLVPSSQFKSRGDVEYVVSSQPPVPTARKNRLSITDQSQSDSINAVHSKGPPHAHVEKKSRDKYASVKSSGYSNRSTTSKHGAAKPSFSPAPKQYRVSSADRNSREPKFDVRFTGSSVDSVAGYISENFSQNECLQLAEMISSTDKPLMASSPVKQEVVQLREQITKLKAQLSDVEKDHNAEILALKASHEKVVNQLKTENYVLSTKLAANSESEQRLKLVAAMKQSDVASQEQLTKLEQDIREQDKLLAGYQIENERMCEEIKRLRANSKATEEKMFLENQKLKIDLANLKDELQSCKNALALSHGDETTPHSAAVGANRIAKLESDLRLAKVREENNKLDVEKTLQSNVELQRRIDQLNATMADLEQQLAVAKSGQSREAKDLSEKYKKELESLHRKLKWYAENQQLLDKDAHLMKEKDEEITSLKAKLEAMSSESGKKQMLLKSGQNERTQQAKRIQDLERQVKEMENIIKKRHPNSLPALIWATSSVPDTGADNRTLSAVHLEGRIQKLEKQLEEKDEEAKRSLRALEQKYNSMRMRYEDRVQSLESANLQLQRTVDELTFSSHPHTNHTAMQRELDSVRDRYRKQVADLESTVEALQKELQAFRSKEFGQLKSTAAKDNEALKPSDPEKQSLQAAISKLENEKQVLMADLQHARENPAKALGKNAVAAMSRTTVVKDRQKPSAVSSKRSVTNSNQLRSFDVEPDSGDKLYVPNEFTGQHISELTAENHSLKNKVEVLELEIQESKVRLQQTLAEAELKERHIQEQFSEQMNALSAAHQQHLQQILTTHAAEHSTSKVAELTSKLATQEVVVQHLKQQLVESKVDAEQLATLNISNIALEAQVKRLTDELFEAKSTQKPEMRHFEAMQDKIAQIEARHRLREQQLQHLVQQQHEIAAQEAVHEANRWRAVVDSKNAEIDRFRSELDEILQVLRQLQMQGIVVPYRTSQISPRRA